MRSLGGKWYVSVCVGKWCGDEEVDDAADGVGGDEDNSVD